MYKSLYLQNDKTTTELLNHSDREDYSIGYAESIGLISGKILQNLGSISSSLI